MLVFVTSGLYQTWSLRWKNSFAASLQIRGYVTRPIQNQLEISLMVVHVERVHGSMGGPVEKIRATSFAWPFDDLSVITLSIFNSDLLVDVNGLTAARE